MADYKRPGVYVEEIPTLPASVAQVETAIPAFIGYTENAEKNGEDLTLKPTRITSLLEYEQYFGKANKEDTIQVKIEDLVDGVGTVTSRTITAKAPTSPSKHIMYYQMQMYFKNGGGPCYIVSVGDTTTSPNISITDLRNGMNEVAKEDEPTLIVFPEAVGLNTAANYYNLYEEALDQCNKLQDRFTIVDTYNEVAADLRSELTSDYLKYGAAYYPYLKTTLNYSYDDSDVTIKHSVDDGSTVSDGALNDDKLDAIKAANNALYNQIKQELVKITMTLPASPTMAGIYARVDRDRGVWKAPANVAVAGIIGPNKKVTNEEQEGLNVDPTAGKSINAIRNFAGKGTLVWGARTLAGNDNEWRYVSVRRFFNMVEESVKKSSGWAVFEPNDANTWTKVRAQIENYLTRLWRDGALAGSKTDDAFFVHVGLGITMTAVDILEGRMIVEVGMAAVRPAEFIVLRFSHKMQES